MATNTRNGAGATVLLSVLVLLATLSAYALLIGYRSDLQVWFALFGLLSLLTASGLVFRSGKSQKAGPYAALMLDAFKDACLITDQNGRPVYANQAYAELAKSHNAKRLVAFEALYAGFPEVSQPLYKLTQALESGQGGEEKVRLKAGSTAPGAREKAVSWLCFSVTPLNGQAKEKLALWRIIDLTEERADQERAFQELQDVVDYLDHAPAGFLSSDPDHNIHYLNATLAEWLKIDLADAANSAVGLRDIIDEEAQTRLLGKGLGANEVRDHNFDLDIKTKDGGMLPRSMIARVRADQDGRIETIQALIMPPSKVDNSAKAGKGLDFTQLFNTAPIAIARVNQTGRIEEANIAFAALFGKISTKGDILSDLVAPDAKANISHAINAVAEPENSGEPTALAEPVEVVFSDGEEASGAEHFQRTGRLYFSAPNNLDGEISVIVYAVDITEQRSLELQFAQSQKMQAVGQLAGGVAHDFNNMLTAIIGFSDLLLVRHKPTDPSFQDIMNVKQNANRAANLVRQLLAFSRRQTLRPDVLSLSDVMSDLGNLLGRLLGEKVTLKTIHGRDLGLVKVDINQFEQVIINLAVNARDAMASGGELTIKTANITEEESKALGHTIMPAGEYIMCEVSDTGTGMSKQVLEKIYEPFFSTKEVGKGTGLGLSTAYGIIKQTGGFIFAESELGEGTSFKIYLPRYYPDETEIAEAQNAPVETKKDLTGDGTILLVEDEDAVRAFAVRALSSRGYTVLDAASGLAALEIAEQQGDNIDLIISDVVMPEMDGPTMLKELRARGVSTKVIFISGYAEEAFKKNLGEDEQFSFLPKPFSLKQLAEAVKQAFDGG